VGTNFWAGHESGEEALVFNRTVRGGGQKMTGKCRTSFGRGPENGGKLSKTEEQKRSFGVLAYICSLISRILLHIFCFHAQFINYIYKTCFYLFFFLKKVGGHC